MNKSLALVIFGITSNLAQIKLLPALYDMEEKGLMPDDFTIIGTARAKKTRSEIIEYVNKVLHEENRHHKHTIDKDKVDKLINRISYLDGNLDDQNFFERLKVVLEDKSGGKNLNKIFYLATYPDLYSKVFENLKKTNLNSQKNGWSRVMVEKPIGVDFNSAVELNKLLLKYFTEDQIYRLDHYLGKETLQNILAFRFSNELFEPLMNSEFIDHIQITAAESFGIGKRGGYFESVGMLKDVGQNHQLQMLAFATMNAPLLFNNEEITKQRLNVLKSLIPLPDSIVLGQYAGYKKEENVSKDSIVDTFYAYKTEINNARYKGVPVYIRAGKKLKETVTEIAIVFKIPKNRLVINSIFGEVPNILIYRMAPNEGIVLKILTKKPGQSLTVEPEYMQFCYKNNTGPHSLTDPYERLISDAINGDQTFFNDAEEVEASWKFIDSIHPKDKKPHAYKPGSWGPKEANELIEKDGKKWLMPSMDFCRI